MKKYAPLFILLLLFVGCRREPPAPTGPVFDVPSLLGKTISEIEKILGPTPTVTKEGETLSRKVWKRDGYTLTITYSPPSGFVSGFTLDTEEARKDEKRDNFLKIGNLKEGDERYQISFIEAEDKVFYFTGARVDVPQTHKVEFRVDGPQAVVTVTYAMLAEGSGGSGDSIMTVPPWTTQTTATIGQQIVLSVAVMTKPGQMPPPQKLKLQIIVDGRVLKEASASGYAKAEVKL